MISFKQYLFETASGNYVSIKVESGLVIPSLEPLFGGSYVCDPSDQHVTLIYSTGTDVADKKIEQALHHYDEIEATLDKVVAFDSTPKDGSRDPDKCTIVVKLKPSVLNDIHEQLKKIGLKHSYPDYSPHISILYNLPIEKKEDAIATVQKWIDKNKDTVSLRGFVIQPIIDDWADSRKSKN